jgi:hypothetical protein
LTQNLTSINIDNSKRNSNRNRDKDDLVQTVADLEKKVSYIFKDAYTIYCDSVFKKDVLWKYTKCKHLFEFLITKYHNQNVRLNTTLTYKVLSLFSKFLHYKDFEKITKNDVMDFLNLVRKTELNDPTHKWMGT